MFKLNLRRKKTTATKINKLSHYEVRRTTCVTFNVRPSAALDSKLSRDIPHPRLWLRRCCVINSCSLVHFVVVIYFSLWQSGNLICTCILFNVLLVLTVTLLQMSSISVRGQRFRNMVLVVLCPTLIVMDNDLETFLCECASYQ